ncbi:F-box domain containing protein [Pandoravirus salinus]|uniref:F-box domain containing protein n=1 Tax=Pandoravirus salinus TaxID=1349410 RepID=S4VVZ9_9VIRU|nr:F-box domain [Pandoravirus salinus]AGO84513.1 F-box domain containing protein [Pandoravirus salinus]
MDRDDTPVAHKRTSPSRMHQVVDFDGLPPEVVRCIASQIDSTVDLVRASMTCRRLAAVSQSLRRERARAWHLAAPLDDLFALGRQLFAAIAMDDPSATVDALDLGYLGLRDRLCEFRNHHGSDQPTFEVGALVGRVAKIADWCPGQTPPRMTPLATAIACGSARCARMLATMGASLNTHEAINAVTALIDHVAWRTVVIARGDADDDHGKRRSGRYCLLNEVVDLRRTYGEPFIPNMPVGIREGGPVDPVCVLRPVFEKGAITTNTRAARSLLVDVSNRATYVTHSVEHCHGNNESTLDFCERVRAGTPALVDLLIEYGC